MHDENQSKETMVAKIKSFSLSYDEHQLIHRSNFRLVVASIDSKRRFFTIVLGSLCLFSFVFAIRSFVSGNIPYFLGSVATITGLWVWNRIRKIRTLYRAFDEYSETNPEPEEPDSLGKQLQLGFRLEYSDYQGIRAGKEQFVAMELIERREKNAVQFLKRGLPIVLAMSGGSYSIGTPLFTSILYAVVCGTPFMIGMGIELRAAQRLKQLLVKYDAKPSG